jgi:hypothetical protein
VSTVVSHESSGRCGIHHRDLPVHHLIDGGHRVVDADPKIREHILE